jgi:exopolysaccharide biosynthesis WecB/TagA/CpsF family protein
LNALPTKFDLFGVKVSPVDYDTVLDAVMPAARAGGSMTVTHLAVHGLIEGTRDPELRAILNQFDIVAPDGQPVRFALNKVHGAGLPDRCYGPELVLRACERAAREGIGVYLYGSHPGVVSRMRDNLVARFAGLNIVGAEPSAFRELSAEEDAAFVRRVNHSGAGLLFLGLGCPLQERFAYAHRDTIHAVQVCVGFAFDVHSGEKKQAPVWMQRYSLEWLFRLLQEPRRLAKRYLVTNSLFLFKLAPYLLGLRKPR